MSISHDAIFCFYHMKNFLMLALAISLFFLTACASKDDNKNISPEKVTPTTSKAVNQIEVATSTIDETATTTDAAKVTYTISSSTDALGLANPAANNCVAKGGILKTVTRTDGNEYSVCYFEDNRQCEEWALFRDECPVGGRRITGYDNDQQIFCAITGGTVDMNKNTCTFKGKVCDLGKYYDGNCNE